MGRPARTAHLRPISSRVQEERGTSLPGHPRPDLQPEAEDERRLAVIEVFDPLGDGLRLDRLLH